MFDELYLVAEGFFSLQLVALRDAARTNEKAKTKGKCTAYERIRTTEKAGTRRKRAAKEKAGRWDNVPSNKTIILIKADNWVTLHFAGYVRQH